MGPSSHSGISSPELIVHIRPWAIRWISTTATSAQLWYGDLLVYSLYIHVCGCNAPLHGGNMARLTLWQFCNLSHYHTHFWLKGELKSINIFASQLTYILYTCVTSSNPASHFSLIPHSWWIMMKNMSPYGVCTHAYPNHGLVHIDSR